MEIEGMSIWKYSAGRMCRLGSAVWGQAPNCTVQVWDRFGEAAVFTKEGNMIRELLAKLEKQKFPKKYCILGNFLIKLLKISSLRRALIWITRLILFRSFCKKEPTTKLV
jgi:hypothetical protein